MPIVVVREPWRLDPLAWIHRAEARAVARELQVPLVLRKYLLRPGRAPFADEALRAVALRIGQVLGVDWAARVDFIVEASTGKAWFLECDAAPLVGPDSAFAVSFSAAGVDRRRQLEWLSGAA